MDATHRMFCENDLINPLSSMGMQVACILVISHFFHIVLKALGQPGPIAQILAGVVLGPSGMSNISKVREVFIQNYSSDYYEIFSFFCRILIMFLIGLEADFQYTLQNLRMVAMLACGGALIGAIFGLSVSFYLYRQLGDNTKLFPFVVVIMLVLTYTASPIVIRLAVDLRIATSNLGRIATTSALTVEISCLLLFNFLLFVHSLKFGSAIYCLLITLVVVVLNKYASGFFNKRNRNHKYLRNPEVFFIIFLVIASSMLIEVSGYSSMINCFVIGLFFPKEGKTARTLLQKLSYSVYNFVLPVYFGYIGFQCNVTYFKSLNNVIAIVILVLLSIGSKLSGTLIACQYLHIPPSEGVFLGFLLNMRGHADLLFLGGASKSFLTISDKAYGVLLISIVISTILSGIIVGFLRGGDDRLFAHNSTALELQPLEDELRILFCVYDPRQTASVLALIGALNGPQTSPTNSYLLHLIELIKTTKSNLLYHQKQDDDLSDDEEYYGGNDVVEIHEAVDAFTAETKILIHQRKAVSSFDALYEDVCTEAEELRVSIIVLPFHKHQRIDGKMESSGKEGIRATNQKILRHAPCSVGVVVERGLAGIPGFSNLIGSDTIQNVATLFFGGPDDREAIAWSIRISKHPRVNLIVFRFLPTPQLKKVPQTDQQNAPNEEKELIMALSNIETATSEIDNAFMVDFYNRYVASGQVGYIEKHLNNGMETIAALKDIGDMYSLFIVGKGARGHCSLTTGLSDWEECPELGTVGDVLAASDFNINGSVLVVQQHRNAKKDLLND